MGNINSDRTLAVLNVIFKATYVNGASFIELPTLHLTQVCNYKCNVNECFLNDLCTNVVSHYLVYLLEITLYFQDDLSGDYKKLVLALIRDEKAGGKK